MLLDTHTFFWLVTRAPLARTGVAAISEGMLERRLLVSAITAWELSNLIRKGRLTLDTPLSLWFATSLKQTGATAVALSADIALAAAELPGWNHQDPADRLLVATARTENTNIVTRDARILAYAEAGHVRAVAC